MPKKDFDEQRVILNLKELNKFIAYHHFKMKTFEAALTLVNTNSMMASVDLRHAYYSVIIHEQDRKFLRFIWEGKVYEYTCLPMGISAPRIFTKIMKPVFAVLHQMGFQSTSYIDDSLLVGDSNDECISTVTETEALLKKLGFIINWKKSVLEPSQVI